MYFGSSLLKVFWFTLLGRFFPPTGLLFENIMMLIFLQLGAFQRNTLYLVLGTITMLRNVSVYSISLYILG